MPKCSKYRHFAQIHYTPEYVCTTRCQQRYYFNNATANKCVIDDALS